MPAAAWPVTEQRNSYMPFFLKVTVTVADWPGWRTFVATPVQLFALKLVAGLAQILKSWKPRPPSVILNSTGLPTGRFEYFESLNASSDGFPAVTVMMVGFAVTPAFRAVFDFARPVAGSAATAHAASKPAASQARCAGRDGNRDRMYFKTELLSGAGSRRRSAMTPPPR